MVMKYYLHNSTYKEADVVIFGVADASGSRSVRARGVSKGPDYIRKISNIRDVFGKGRKVESLRGEINKKVCDSGNIKKDKVTDRIHTLICDSKIPLIFGGDHSITSEIAKGISKRLNKKFAFLYFDAHPDYRCNAGKYYGSVLCELRNLKNVSFKNSVLIGMRAPERAELAHIKKSGLLVITPEDIELHGVKKISQKIHARIGRLPVYVSIDMDVIDPSAAPGVDTPVPAGLSATQLLTLIEQLGKKRIIGADVCEVNPRYDIQHMTGHLASRVVAEIVANV